MVNNIVDFHIEFQDIETIKTIVSIIVLVLPVVFGFLFWIIRRIDVSGQRRLKWCVEQNKETVDLMQSHINALKDSMDQYNVERIYLEKEVERYKVMYNETERRLVDLKKEFDELLDKFSSLQYNIQVKSQERRLMHLEFFIKSGLSKDVAEKILDNVNEIKNISGSLKYNAK